jgi:hypothetical protein
MTQKQQWRCRTSIPFFYISYDFNKNVCEYIVLPKTTLQASHWRRVDSRCRMPQPQQLRFCTWIPIRETFPYDMDKCFTNVQQEQNHRRHHHHHHRDVWISDAKYAIHEYAKEDRERGKLRNRWRGSSKTWLLWVKPPRSLRRHSSNEKTKNGRKTKRGERERERERS